MGTLLLIWDAFDQAMPEKLGRFGNVTDDRERLGDADVLLVRSSKVDRAFINRAPKLKVIIRGGVGTDNIDKECCAEKKIVVRNTPKASAVAVAELAMSLMLAASCNLVFYEEGMEQGKWLKKEKKRTELYGKTLALIGMGHIATEVAKRAAAFGMRIIGYDAYVTETPYAMASSLESAVKDADYISLHVPLTDETRGMVNGKLLSCCTKKPVVINTCRALVVDEKDMAKLLDEGKVACYASDVWNSDPVTDADPLYRHPGVLMTPHVGANTRENLLRIGDEAVDVLAALREKGAF